MFKKNIIYLQTKVSGANFANIRAGRKTQVQPIWRGDSSPYLLRRIHEGIKYFH